MLRKDESGAEIADFPFFHTASAARSHVKCFLLADYKVDISDKRRFPNWGAWWKAYLGEVLKPNGKMQVKELGRALYWICRHKLKRRGG